jgi:hypothetical protein
VSESTLGLHEVGENRADAQAASMSRHRAAALAPERRDGPHALS